MYKDFFTGLDKKYVGYYVVNNRNFIVNEFSVIELSNTNLGKLQRIIETKETVNLIENVKKIIMSMISKFMVDDINYLEHVNISDDSNWDLINQLNKDVKAKYFTYGNYLMIKGVGFNMISLGGEKIC